MTARYRLALVLSLLLTGCVRGAAPPAPGPSGFSYAVPQPPTVAYVTGDTTHLAMGGAAATEVISGYRAVTELEFAGGDPLRVTARIRELDGRYESPGLYVDEAGAADIPGPIRLELARDGEIEEVRLPELSRTFMQVAGTDGLVRALFVHLPEGPVSPGAEWTDTVRISEVGEESGTTGVTVIRSTWDADSIIDGRRLHVFRTRAQSSIVVSGVTEGVAYEQRLAGVTRGTVLWDPERRLLVERVEQGELSGAFDAPAAGRMGTRLLGTVTRRVRLRD